jgi:gliding motility-associated lipoprotein GldH
MGMEPFKRFFFIIALSVSILACEEITLYERQENVPGGAWKSGKKLSFSLEIEDTVSNFQLFTSIRHTSEYPYRNIWVRMGLQLPGSDSVTFHDFDLPLADAEKWLGTGMNDVYDRRIRLFGDPFRFPGKGKAVFTLQQIMREEELPGILQVGIRIEPVKQ